MWVPATSVRNTVWLYCCTIQSNCTAVQYSLTVLLYNTCKCQYKTEYIYCKISQHSSWPCRAQPGAVLKVTLHIISGKSDRRKVVRCRRRTFQYLHNFMKITTPYYKQMKITLHNCSILAYGWCSMRACWHTVGAACEHAGIPLVQHVSMLAYGWCNMWAYWHMVGAACEHTGIWLVQHASMLAYGWCSMWAYSTHHIQGLNVQAFSNWQYWIVLIECVSSDTELHLCILRWIWGPFKS